MNLLEAFEQNLVEDVRQRTCDKIIETIISKIFFYGQDVYKVYKYEKFFFADFTSKDSRRKFYMEDFFWNRIMAPNIYLELKPAADDFFIKMKKFDDENNLTNLLLKNKISEKDIGKIVSEFVSRMKTLTESRKNSLEYDFNKKLIDIHLADLESDKNLLYLIPSFISKNWADKTFNFLKEISTNNSYFLNYNQNNLSLLIDNHADNVLFSNGEADFVDVLPPKESWRVGNLFFNICRFATDIAVLLNEDKAKAVYLEYPNSESIPEQVKRIYEIRSALIQMWCFCAVDKLDIAKKYLKFAENKIYLLKK